MANPVTATLFSEARVPGADGSYTVQRVYALSIGGTAAIILLEHDLGRIPDWVRVRQIAKLDPATGVPIQCLSYLIPFIKDALNPTTGRFEWQDTVVAVVADLTKKMFFVAANGDGVYVGLVMVEYGITHSQSK